MNTPAFARTLARERRIQLGLSVEDVAARIDRSPQSVYAYEGRGVSPPPPVRRRLEQTLGLDAGALLCHQPEHAA